MDAQADLNVCCMHMPTCTLCWIPAYIIFLKEGMKRKQGLGLITNIIEPRHEISKNVVCATSTGSYQPAHMRSLIRVFDSHLNIL